MILELKQENSELIHDKLEDWEGKGWYWWWGFRWNKAGIEEGYREERDGEEVRVFRVIEYRGYYEEEKIVDQNVASRKKGEKEMYETKEMFSKVKEEDVMIDSVWLFGDNFFIDFE